MLDRQLESLQNSQDFQNGIVNLANLRFAEAVELEVVNAWLSDIKEPVNVLWLQGCNICETESIRSLFSENTLSGERIVPPAWSLVKFKSFKRTKAEVVASIIRNKKDWLEINISANNLSLNETEIIIKTIVSEAKKIRNLNLSHNVLGEQGAKALAEYLQSQNGIMPLKHLNLTRTFHSKKCFRILINALKNNKTLRELDIDNNDFIDLQEIVELLEVNTTLTSIKFSTENASPKLIRKIIEQLEQNIQKREKRFQELLSHERFLVQAIMAIRKDDDVWLDVLIGVDKKKKEEQILFDQQNYDSFYAVRKLYFKCSVLKYQTKFISEIQSEDLLSEAKLVQLRKQLDEIMDTAARTENSVILERLDRSEMDKHDIELTPSRRQEIAREFREGVTQPILKEMQLELNSNMDLIALQSDYECQANEAEKIYESAEKARTDLQQAHYLYQIERERLLSRLKTLDLNRETIHDFEEIADKFIEVHLDPNSVDSEGNTLLFLCFSQNKPKCMDLLLKRGANILKKNDDGKSTFSELIANFKSTPCHTILVKHIKFVLEKIWFNFDEYPEKNQLKRIKKTLDSYLEVLIKNSEMPMLKQVFLGVRHCLDDRKQELEACYSFLKEASFNHERNSLNTTLSNMLEVAQKAKRGWRHQSQLHDNLTEKLLPLLKELNSEEMEAQLAELQSEFEKNYEEYQREQEEKKKKDELDLQQEVFETITQRAEKRRSTSIQIPNLGEQNGSRKSFEKDEKMSPIQSFWHTLRNSKRSSARLSLSVPKMEEGERPITNLEQSTP